jgi:hypothetical protein
LPMVMFVTPPRRETESVANSPTKGRGRTEWSKTLDILLPGTLQMTRDQTSSGSNMINKTLILNNFTDNNKPKIAKKNYFKNTV